MKELGRNRLGNKERDDYGASLLTDPEYSLLCRLDDTSLQDSFRLLVDYSGLDEKSFAKKAHIETRRVRNLENGTTKSPTNRTIFKVISVFDWSPDHPIAMKLLNKGRTARGPHWKEVKRAYRS